MLTPRSPSKAGWLYLRLRDSLSRLPIPRMLLTSSRIPVARNLLLELDQTFLRLFTPDTLLRREFNRWAEMGLGESMERDHKWVAERTIPKMGIASGDRVLDLGCGDGWTCRLMAERLGRLGRVVGLDISDEMVHRARIKSRNLDNLTFLCGSAEHIPCGDEVFTKVLSISAFYYFHHQETVLKELFRVVAPEGRLFLLTCIYKELPGWLSSVRGIRVPVQVRSADEYKSILQAAGWRDVRTEELLRGTEPAHNRGRHDRALLISGLRSKQ
jgi:SAM-dependent methyltransferase